MMPWPIFIQSPLLECRVHTAAARDVLVPVSDICMAHTAWPYAWGRARDQAALCEFVRTALFWCPFNFGHMHVAPSVLCGPRHFGARFGRAAPNGKGPGLRHVKAHHPTALVLGCTWIRIRIYTAVPRRRGPRQFCDAHFHLDAA